MNRLILAAALAAGFTLAISAPSLAAARNYDCSKAGNANKAACKGKIATAAPKAAEAKMKPTKAAASKGPAAPQIAAAKPGKGTLAVKTTAAVKPAAQPGILQRMSNALHGSKTVPTQAAAPKKAAGATPASAENSNPTGAIAQCKDGSYSHSKVRSGACSRHGGVAKWS